MKRMFPALLTACLAYAHGADHLSMHVLDTYATGVFDESAAEIGAFDPVSQRLFVVNGDSGAIDVLNLADPSQIGLLFSIDVSAYGNQANSVAVHGSTVVAAVEAGTKQNPGQAVFFDTNGTFLNQVTVGALPDMVIFTPDGNKVLVANEGEPSDDISVDPEGSISIIDISAGVGSATVTTAGFAQFNGQTLDPSIRIFTPGSTVAQDLEPEYIAVAPDSATAWAVCQENNALAVIDLASGTVTQLLGLGFKDHSQSANRFDPSNRDSGIELGTWPVWGMYQPDAVVAFSSAGTTYLITANEGDSRDYGGFSEEARIKDLILDPTAFPNAAQLQEDENLGRLKTTITLGDDDNDGDFDRLFAFGARSFSIWNGGTGQLVYDSGDDIETLISQQLPAEFNSSNDENDSFDSRSDDKGPEPEGLTIGEIAGSTYAFLGLERIGGVMVFDVSNPNSPSFIQYLNNRDFSGDPATGTAGDLGPEGLSFISAQDSPNGHPLLAVMNEVSGTTTVYQLNFDCEDGRILDIAPVGERGITLSGGYDCTYVVTISRADGTEQIYRVVVDESGVAVLDITIEPDMLVSVALDGGATTDEVATVPTLGTWGLIVLVGLLMIAAVIYNRRKVAVS